MTRKCRNRFDDVFPRRSVIDAGFGASTALYPTWKQSPVSALTA